MLSETVDASVLQATLPRSFSAPYPPLEGILEEGTTVDSWQWDSCQANQVWRHQQHPPEDEEPKEDYQQAMRIEGYILSLLQRRTLSPRPCQPRTTLNPDPPHCSASGHSSLHRKTLTTDRRFPDPRLHPPFDLSPNPKSQAWGCDLLEEEGYGGEAPSLEEDGDRTLPYPPCRPRSLTGRLPSPLPSMDPECHVGAINLCFEPSSPQYYLPPESSIHHKHNLSSQYVPGQSSHAPMHSPRHYDPEQPSPNFIVSYDTPKPRTSKKTHNERQKSKKSSSRTSHSQSENSLLPERRYSTTERHQGRADTGPNHAARLDVGNNGGRRWCSNLELSQDEGESHTEQAHRRLPRKTRHGPLCPHSHARNPQQQHPQHWQSDFQGRAPLCQAEEGHTGAAPAESESSMSEVYSPASSSLSSDSDESGGLVWPQQLPPRLATTSSSSSPSPHATANPPSQPKAFVKIKASHALKKKILRFRSGSLKVMTTV